MKNNPYSISKLACYSQCPLEFKLRYLDKIKTPFTKNLALHRGSYIHKIIENKYNYNTKTSINQIFTYDEQEKAKKVVKKFQNSELGLFYSKFENDYKFNAIHEESFGFKMQNSRPIVSKFTDKESLLVGKIDFQFLNDGIAYNIDWKSGRDKSNDTHFGIEQSMAYSIYLLLKYSYINKVVSKFVFIEHETQKQLAYDRDKLDEYIKYFVDKISVIENDNIYKAHSGDHCNYCDFYTYGYCDKGQLIHCNHSIIRQIRLLFNENLFKLKHVLKNAVTL